MHERDLIAVVGMAGRFAGAPDIDRFWDNLCEGRCGVRRFSRDELAERGVPAERLDDPDFVPAGAEFEGIAMFDANFFDFTPREAEVCGPQQRHLLECAHLALEDAGCAVDKCGGRVGTFVGVGQSNYLQVNLGSHPELAHTVGARTVQFGNDITFAATQIAYKLDLRGPAIGVATACSTSLVAIHLARRSLLDRECDVALAGGAQVSIDHDRGYRFSEGGIHSPDGTCRSFDAEAAGTVSGNGVGIVVLRRLDDALADGDRVIAVLCGSAINNDGQDKVGYSAPSVTGQAAVIAAAHAAAGIQAEKIGFVEAHGTATPLGDPIEMAGLTEAFRATTSRREFCALGSVKSNLGHMGAAAGVGGFMKATLAVARGCIPPTLHFRTPNPALQLDRSPFFVNAERLDWDAPIEQRVAGVSSFGMGGTNAHAVLRGHAARASLPSARRAQLVVLSARTGAALERLQQQLAEQLDQAPGTSLADLAYTFALGRRDHEWRRSIVADSIDALREACRAAKGGTRATGRPSIAFLFPGQGAQHVGMANGVYATEPAFREAFDACAQHALAHTGFDLRQCLRGVDDVPLDDALVQPLLFAVEYAYARTWMGLGVQPQAMLGHSLGEYVAATLADVFTLDAAVELVCARGRLMASTAPGAMLSVAAEEESLRPLLGPQCSLAAVNGPASCVLSGRRDVLESVAAQLQASDITTQWLPVAHAFHSAAMDPILEPFLHCVRRAAPSAPTRRFVSSVTGQWCTDKQASDPLYWVRQIREPVRFDAAVRTLAADGHPLAIEIGPGQVLSGLLKRRDATAGELRFVASAPHARNLGDDGRALLAALGEVWSVGHKIDFASLFADERRCKITVPGHPLERGHFWIEPRQGRAVPYASQQAVDERDWLHTPAWRQQPLRRKPTAADPLWLVLDETGMHRSALRSALDASATVLRLQPAATFAQLAADLIALDAADTAQLDRLVAAVPMAGRTVHVVDFGYSAAGADAHAAVSRRALPLARLLHALARAGADVRAVAVTASGHAVLGDESIDPASAGAWAAARVATHEHHSVRAAQLDVAECTTPAALATHVVDEFAAGLPDIVVAWRRGRRYVRDFLPVDAAGPGTPRLQPRMRWLITGGLGGIGLVLARHLAESYQARLVLVGRGALPARQDWSAWLAAHPATHRTARVLRELLAIEQAGGELLVLAADVSSATSVQYVIERARARFGGIDGLIHAAGVAGSEPIGLLDDTGFSRAIEAKVDATQHLFAQLGDELQLALLCSSQNAIKGGIGKLGYCAANAYLDAFAEAHEAPRPHCVSINWCTWREVGMAVDASGALNDRRAREAIGNDEAVRLFERATAASHRRLIVSRAALVQVLDEFDALQREQLEQSAALIDSRSGGSRPDSLSQPFVEPASPVERDLCAIWSSVLGVEPIGALDNFFELGGSSLLVTQVALQIKQRFGITASLQGLFATLTVREQAAHVVGLQSTTTDSRQLEAMLAELEVMSDDDIAAMLNS